VKVAFRVGNGKDSWWLNASYGKVMSSVLEDPGKSARVKVKVMFQPARTSGSVPLP
jgi:hypothetical protein